MIQEETEKERKARLALERYLNPGEDLLEFTRCKKGGRFRSQFYFIGLTPNRLILNPIEGGKIINYCFSIWLHMGAKTAPLPC